MLGYLTVAGRRKFVLGVLFIFVSWLEILGVVYAVSIGEATGWDAAGMAALLSAQAAGVFTIVWGNVREHEARARNGEGERHDG